MQATCTAYSCDRNPIYIQHYCL